MACERLRQQFLSGYPLNYVSRSGEQVPSQCKLGFEKGTPTNPNLGVLGWVALFSCDTLKLVKVSGILSTEK